MATTGANRRGARHARTALAALAALALLGALGSCIRPAATTGGGAVAEPERPDPSIAVGLAVGAAAVAVGGGGPLVLSEPDGGFLGRVPAGVTVRVTPVAGGMSLRGTGVEPLSAEALVVTADSSAANPAGTVRLNGREYRGEAALLRDRTGLTLVNRVGLEAYLAGVLASEMGRRDPAEREALRAQAIVSRTYAMRNMGRWRSQGFDLYATVADQVYAGASSEYALAGEAVAATRGQILTYGGAPIDAFFFSTCGGRTADGAEIFRNARDATHPYLRSVSDVGPDGAYCRYSPRFEWTEEWTGAALKTTLQRTLPEVARVPPAQVREVRGVRVAGRTRSGRAAQLAVALRSSEVIVDGPSIRQVLRAPSGDILRSNAFTLSASGGRTVTRLVADGHGAGHGVGFCQWGAVGRARAGQGYREILAAYYPSTALERRY